MAEYGVKVKIEAQENAGDAVKKVKKEAEAALFPLEKLQKKLQSIGKKTGITHLRDKVKGLTGSLKEAGAEARNFVGCIGLLGGGIIGGAVLAFNKLFLSVASGNEQLGLTLRNVTGSAQGAQNALGLVQKSIRGMPVDANDAANAFMRLKSAGLEPQADTMKRLADVAGHTGKSLTEVAECLAGLKQGQTGGLAELLGGNVKQAGNYIVAEFADAQGRMRRMAVRQGADARKNAAALQKLYEKAMEAKGIEGGAKRFGSTWQGMIARAQSLWQRFAGMVMDSGPFQKLKSHVQDILAQLEKLEETGGLKAIAEEWGQTFCDAIDSIWENGKKLVGWFQNDFLPAFGEVKTFLGGWGGVLKAVAAIMAGPLIVALALAGKAVIGFGIALMTTPVGWIMLAIASIAGVVYLLYKNWGKISAWLKQFFGPLINFFSDIFSKIKNIFSSIWDSIVGYISGVIDRICGAFDQGFLQGLLQIFKEFNPLSWIMGALDNLTQYLFGFSLIDAGKGMINSLWDGIVSVWDGLKEWLYSAWESLTGWLPDKVKEWLGIRKSGGQPGGPPPTPSAKDFKPSDPPHQLSPNGFRPSGQPTGAVGFMSKGSSGYFVGPQEQTIKTEVVITGENLPPGLKVSTPKSQADKTNIDCGYMLPGVG